ncbi:MAG TPA: prenyltransferase/squalene oxidase repeat-containing protein [Chloroflexia bacterium]|nr:prenyltransferase/squalene oxidase repeat-containing protein [Chloroflexia bacterium]
MFSATTRLRKWSATGLASLVMLITLVGTASAQTYPAAANKGLAWMKTQQQPDGSFVGFGTGSTMDAVLAIVAAGQDPATYVQGGNTPISFLESKTADIVKAPGGAGKLLHVVETLGMDGKSFGGINLVDTINSTYNADTGQYGPDVIGHAFSILGLTAAGQSVPDKAIAFLDSMQTQDNGWSFSGEKGSGAADTNTTSVVMQVYVALGVNDQSHQHMLRAAWLYLMSQQNPDGGFPYQQGSEFGSESDVNSTSYVIQALLSVGGTEDALKPMQYLLSLQKPNGAFQWKQTEPDDNAGATYQAVPALLGATLAAPTGAKSPLNPAPNIQPGMPRTGSSDASPIIALVMLPVLAVGAGIVIRRKVAAR